MSDIIEEARQRFAANAAAQGQEPPAEGAPPPEDSVLHVSQLDYRDRIRRSQWHNPAYVGKRPAPLPPADEGVQITAPVGAENSNPEQWGIIAAARARQARSPHFARQGPRRSSLPCFVVSATGPRVREMDPLLPAGAVVPWPGLEGEALVTIESVVELALSPVPLGEVPLTSICREVYEMALAAIGVPDDGSTSDACLEEGRAAVVAALAELPPAQGLAAFREERPTRVAMAESVGRAWGLPAEEIVKLTGRPFAARPLLAPASSKAKALIEERAAKAAEADREAERARAAKADADRPNERTLAELGLTAVRVPTDDELWRAPPALNLATFHVVPEGRVCFWRTPPGLNLPAGTAAGIEVLPPDHVLAMSAREVEALPLRAPSPEIVALARALYRRLDPMLAAGPVPASVRAGRDLGPITEWSKAGHDEARAFAAKWAAVPRTVHDGSLVRLVALAIVRGMKVRPDHAASIIRDAYGERLGATIEQLGAWCAEAAQSGDIEAGSLLTLPSKKNPKKEKV